MNLPAIASTDQWLAARKELLAAEKALTRARDELNRQRRALPMVRVEKGYTFDGPSGGVALTDLFEGRHQLIVYHFMFHRETGEGCHGCSYLIDNVGRLEHLHARDTTLAMVSRAPLHELESFKARMDWSLPWYSSFDSDFNYDFHATIDEAVAPVEYNYRDKAELEAVGHTYHLQGEQPGISVFLREGDEIFHTYSSYGRGMDMVLTTYHYLDLTPFGRGEGWDGMPDLFGKGQDWTKLHDRYGAEDRPCARHA